MRKHFLFNEKFITTILFGLMCVDGNASDSGSAEQSPTSNPMLQALDAGTSKKSTNSSKSPILEQKLNNYMKSPFAFSVYHEKADAIKAGIQDYIKATGRWPDDLGVKEQFYLNISYLEKKETQQLFACRKKLNWNSFKQFAQIDSDEYCIYNIIFPVYIAFPNTEDRSEFMALCEPYLEGEERYVQVYIMNVLFSIYQTFPNAEERSECLTFCETYLEGMTVDRKSMFMKHLLSIYLAYPSVEERSEFIKFCETYLNWGDKEWTITIMNCLLPTFQAFPSVEDRSEFMKFCEPYFNVGGQAISMNNLLSIYQDFPNAEDRSEFIKFCEPYFKMARHKEMQSCIMKELLPIYKTFSNTEDRSEFIKFCKPYLEGEKDKTQSWIIKNILPIYQAYPSVEDRSEFIKLCDPYFKGMDKFSLTTGMNRLLSIYQSFLNAEDRSEFMKFCEPYLKKVKTYRVTDTMNYLLEIINISKSYPTFIFLFEKFNQYINKYHLEKIDDVISSFLPRTYLCYMRTFSSLEAENNPNQNRIQANFETRLAEQLPVVWVQDPFIAKARNVKPFANAHEFDSIYPGEFDLLKLQTNGYKDELSSKAYTPYNNNEVTTDFYTHTEVEDFIQYLDTEFLTDSKSIKIDGINYETTQIVSIVKQILGLEPKSVSVSGGFEPYLGSSMFYAQPDAPKGDEVLGRIWYLVKELGQKESDEALESGNDKEIEKAIQHAKALKRSVILAILEAAEISQTGAETHCQTRITGELLKAICLHLGESQLRGLIMHETIQTNEGLDAETNARIEAAPKKAQQLFKAIHRGESGSIKALWEKHINEGTKPELFELYLAYYDALYQRTVISDVDGSREYQKDEHILMRDDHGNLVNFYSADGTTRETPLIVYYQAEFQVLEHTFTELMRQEFEEHRSVKY